MKGSLKKFIVGLTLFTFILGAITALLWYLLPEKYFSPMLPFMFPFFFILTLIIFYALTKTQGAAFSNFVNRFMVAIFGKMILCIIILLAYVFTNRNDAVGFILTFFILYIFYSFYEVIALLRHPFPGKK